MQKKIAIFLVMILIAGSTSAYGYVVGLYTDSSGNVGVGTISPSQKLHVVGPGGATVLINSTTNIGPSLTLGSGLNSGIPIKLRSTGSGDPEGSKSFAITNSSNGVNFLLINSTTGNVGIGTTSPKNKLDVNGNLDVLNGNVGIGTSNPLRKLHIVGNDSGLAPSYLRIANIGAANGGGAALEFAETYGNPDNSVQVTSQVARIVGIGVNPSPLQGVLYFQTYRDYSGLQTAMTIYPNGNVGINTTNPQNTLDVNGNLDVKSGTNPVYKCTTAGALPIGALTTNSASCGTTIDTGLRVP